MDIAFKHACQKFLIPLDLDQCTTEPHYGTIHHNTIMDILY